MSRLSDELDLAKTLVVEKLKLDNSPNAQSANGEGTKDLFIEKHKQQIFNRLEDLYKAEEQHELAFIAESFPLISGIVHLGSTVQDYRNATAWLTGTNPQQGNMPSTDPAAVISALTFVYLVDKGVKDPEIKGTDREDTWKKMDEIVTRILT